jgi:hypothetical protein
MPMTPAKLLWIAAALMTGAAFPASAAPDGSAPTPGPLRSFKDWVVGCDNLRSCVALGLSPEGQDNAYLRIGRGGGAADEPEISFSVLFDEAPKDPTLTFALDGGPTPRPIKGAVDGSFVKASLPPQEARSFLSALKSAKTLTLTLHGAASPFRVSLAGSAAALLFMDDSQGRVGGVTALAKPGPAPGDRRAACSRRAFHRRGDDAGDRSAACSASGRRALQRERMRRRRSDRRPAVADADAVGHVLLSRGLQFRLPHVALRRGPPCDRRFHRAG